MGQSSLNFDADEDEPNELPGADEMPSTADPRNSSSDQSSKAARSAASELASDAARSANATRAVSATGGHASNDANSPATRDAAQDSRTLAQPGQSHAFPSSPNSPASSVYPLSALGGGSSDNANNSDIFAPPDAATGAPLLRRRQPLKQIGQLPDIAPLPSFDEWYANPGQGQLGRPR